MTTFLQAPLLIKHILFFSSPISVSFLVFGPSVKQKLLHAKRSSSETEPHRKTWATNIPCWATIHLQM